MAPNREVKQIGFDPHTLSDLRAGGFLSIDASVPGNFELDLVRAGLAPDPYFAQNPFAFQQYENRHLWYAVAFSSDTEGDENTFLHFAGIDTIADIFLNGELLGHTENMLIEHEFSVAGRLRAENELIVHIFPTMIEARRQDVKPYDFAQRYNYETLRVRKAASMFGWDIMPRFVSGGIWKPVTLLQKPRERLEETYLYLGDYQESTRTARMAFHFNLRTDEDFLKGLKITLDGVCEDSSFHVEHDVWHTGGKIRFTLTDPKLWWPRNAGKQNLYDVKATLTRDGVLCDETSFRFGVRTVELLRTSTTDEEGNGEFVFKINGKKIFCLGTNWVPLDAFPSKDSERLAPALEMVEDIGCNMIRCWGGNVYENNAFYDYCDEHGIMIWQDFGMGCAVYPQDAGFAEVIRKEAVAVIKRLRSHASLVLWAGDNEVDVFSASDGFKRDPNHNILTRQILPQALRENDVVRPYLPSSPYVDEEAFRTKKPTSEEHLWGPRDYFKGKYYGTSKCHFASETGYHGCPSPRSLEKFISKDLLWPMLDEAGNPNGDYLCHAAEMQPTANGPYAYRIGLMTKQVQVMFGGIPDNLADFAKQSQISQGEAFKYFIERFRVTKWRRTGIIWWNLIDGWPQVSDAVVDWYHCKKLAYHYIKRSQNPLCLIFDEPQNGASSLYAVNDTDLTKAFRYTVKDVTTGVLLAEGSAVAEADASTLVITIPAFEDYHFLCMEWETEDGIRGSNHFTTKLREIDADAYLADLQKVGYDEFEGF